MDIKKNDVGIVDLAWFMRESVREQGLGPINWELVAARLYEEGWINEDRYGDNKQVKTRHGSYRNNNEVVDPRD